VGTIEVGKRADLLLVSANPLVDATALRDAAGVMTAGRWLDRDNLDLLLRAAILEGAW
jgi:imidazolonepropionase-like amidohydrolase